MKGLRQLLCRHKDIQTIYRNEKPSKNLKHIIKYEVVVCKKCKKRLLINEGRNPYKIIKERV